MLDPVSPASAIPGANPTPKDDPVRIKESSKQFEALLIGSMLKSMSDSEGGWLGTGDDESASSAMEYATESFAQALAASGGLGISALVAKGLSAAPDSASSPGQTSGPSRI